MENKRTIKSYVLRSGRFTQRQKNAIDNLSGKYCLEFKNEKLDFDTVYNNKNEVIIEIGFGMGDSTVVIAKSSPETNILGIEVHKPGVGALLDGIDINGLTNVRIINHDAVEVLNSMIQDGSVKGFHIFFPDPWQKKKHNKRRLINPELTALLVKKIKKGGYIYLATDWENYAEQMIEVLEANPDLKNSSDKYSERAPWRPVTKFEKKGLAKNHKIFDIWFNRI